MQLELTQLSKNDMTSIQNDCQGKTRREQLELQWKAQCKLLVNYLERLHDTSSESC